MKPYFISHSDFAQLEPINVFHKEHADVTVSQNPKALQNKHILYRKKVYLNASEGAILRISADDHYKLYINGKFVCEGPAPAYPNGYYFNELDISEYLSEGENTFAVHTYYQGLINRAWVSGDLRQMLWLELESNGKTALVTDESWKCTYHTAYTSCGKLGYDTVFTECFDARSRLIGFEHPNFDDSDWGFAKIKKHPDYNLIKQPTTTLAYEAYPPVFTEKRENTLFIDFGREAVGNLSALFKGSSGDTVVFRYGEELNDDGTVRFNARCNCSFEEKMILSGKTDRLDFYDYKAYRYAEMILPDGAEASDISFTARFYPYEEKAKFPDHGEDFKKIIRLCADTVKYGTQECYIDCPSREKGQYLGDVSIAARSQAILTGDTSMMKKAISEFCRSTFICPGIMAITNAAFMQEIADYSLQFPAQVLWVYKTDGDRGFFESTKPYLDAQLEYFKKYMREDGLLDGVTEKWNLVDWPHNLRDGYNFPLTIPIGKGAHNVLNAFWIGYLKALDEINELLGTEKTGLAEKAEASFINAFFNRESGLFCDGEDKAHSSVQSNALPLLFGMCDKDEINKQHIVDLIMKKKLTSMGVYMAYFTLAGLVNNGYEKEALELTLDPKCWLNMLSQGATTTFEAWGKEQKSNCSLFHPWTTAPIIIFAENNIVY